MVNDKALLEGSDVSVIVAAYNEHGHIEDTVNRIHKTYPKAEIIVVDDGSKDDTANIVKNLKVPGLRLVTYSQNRGKGYAIRMGIKYAQRPIQAQVDADSQFPPEELPNLVEPIRAGKADIVFASRFIPGATRQKGSITKIRYVANYVVSGITSILCFKRFTDVNAGFKAWTTKSIRDCDILCDHFAYEPEIAIMAGKKGYSILEVPVNYKGRAHGKTSVNLVRDGIIIPLFLLKTKFFR